MRVLLKVYKKCILNRGGGEKLRPLFFLIQFSHELAPNSWENGSVAWSECRWFDKNAGQNRQEGKPYFVWNKLFKRS